MLAARSFGSFGDAIWTNTAKGLFADHAKRALHRNARTLEWPRSGLVCRSSEEAELRQQLYQRPFWLLFVVFAFLAAPALLAQNAEISGLITDPSGLAVPNAKVAVQSADTAAARAVSSNQQGEYSVPALLPGPYNVMVEANGFKTVRQNGVVVEVDQRARLDFALTIGNNTDTVTVQGSTPLLNTSDASVSTLIGNRFVENMPLNGRSFSSLIDLTPGVVLTPTNSNEQGQFSVNGQRPDANYFVVDGVSANLGNAGNGGPLNQTGASGGLPATSAFGGTSNLVSLDAMQEFRVQTSTFAPEYGRTPGAQISVVTKSGTNAFHGTGFEYFRNDKLDANDWFANRNALARPELRQNDFGGVLGGPLKKEKLFFFGSYEGLRVRQPHVANTYVPSLASRQNAPTLLQPLLNAFPLPNGPDLGNGTAAFSASYSDPSTLNSSGIRVDYLPWQRVTIFGRYSDAPSSLTQRTGGAYTYTDAEEIKYRTQALTLGSNQALTPRLTNEFRFNYSRSRANAFYRLDNFGGAVPPPDSVLYPSGESPQNALALFYADSTPYGISYDEGKLGDNLEQQFNVTDNVSRIVGAHQMKFGLDYRRLSARDGLVPYTVEYVFNSLANVLANTMPEAYVAARAPDTELVFANWSLFAQDAWKAARTLTITYGLRWEYNAAPSSPNGTLPLTVTGVDNLATARPAPVNTPLWHPQKHDFAPRLGVAWQPLPNLVVRAGAGIFYDLGYSVVAGGISASPYAQGKAVLNTSFPLSAAIAAPPSLTTTPPLTYVSVVNPDHVLPRTYEWNAALERVFGKVDVITVTYLGAAGRRLMREDLYLNPNPDFGELKLLSNSADSGYQALQAQFRHRFSHGLQTLLSYTWAHSIDDVSSDANYLNVPLGDSPSERGSSDYDIRHTLSGAVSYDIPAPGSGIWKLIFGSWSTDSIIYVRSAPPVNVVTGHNTFGVLLSTANSVQRPNLVPGVPLWISDPNVAEGRRINKAAFSVPAGPVQGNLGRNALNGFGATEVDLTLRRQFHLRERLSLQARADFFNIFNHPNFGPPVNYMTSPLFGQATQMLGASLGSGGQSGGLNPLYQIGGPRSAQLALKLQF
jgi:Carboxypeptidase regulatory-like domain/TonB dependent receptor